jgi:predicted nucleic acid-binding protein
VTDKVVDTSALAAIVFDELDRPKAEALLKNATLFAPALIDFEMASVCLKKIRQRPAERAALLSAFDGFRALTIHRVNCDLSETIALAQKRKLSLYDATYLWLAQNLNIELATLDTDFD